MSPSTSPPELPWLEGSTSRQDDLSSRVPDSPRLQRLVRDLETIMMSEGFLHLSTEELARRLRCSKATLYRLAPSREELFELVIDQWLSRIRDAGYRELVGARTWPERLIAYLAVLGTGGSEPSHRYLQDLRAVPGGLRVLMDHQSRRIEVLEAIIAGGVEAGDFEDIHSHLAADVILTSVRRAVEPAFLASVGLSSTNALNEWSRVLAYGLMKPDARSDHRRHRRAPD